MFTPSKIYKPEIDQTKFLQIDSELGWNISPFFPFEVNIHETNKTVKFYEYNKNGWNAYELKAFSLRHFTQLFLLIKN